MTSFFHSNKFFAGSQRIFLLLLLAIMSFVDVNLLTNNPIKQLAAAFSRGSLKFSIFDLTTSVNSYAHCFS